MMGNYSILAGMPPYRYRTNFPQLLVEPQHKKSMEAILLAPERIAWRELMHSLCATTGSNKTDTYISGIVAISPREVEAEIKSYEEDVALLQTLIERKRRIVAFWRSRPVPNEILGHVFSECRRMDPWAPVIISHVCRHWRQVCLRHRELWAGIELGRREASLARASEWAERAGNFSLDLSIRCSKHAPSKNIIPWLQEKSGDIKSLTILHMALREANRLLPVLPSFRRMESLRILGLEDFDLDMRWITRLLRGSPALTSLSLSGVSTLLYPKSLVGIAAQLTHLSIGALSHIDCRWPLQANAVLDIISACPSLRTLECHSLSAPVVEPAIVSLPLLSSISVGDGPETCVILKYLNVPQLRLLRLLRGQILDGNEELVEISDIDDGYQDYVEFFLECLDDLHRNCSPKIITVIWERTTVDIGVLKNCTEYIRDMERLEFRYLEIVGMESLSSFLPMEVGGCISPYPQLQSIKFTQCMLAHRSLELTVTARGSGVPRIRPINHPLTMEDCQRAIDEYRVAVVTLCRESD